jgi:putative transposase
MEGYHLGSYGYLRSPKARPSCPSFDAVLSAASGLADRKAGWSSYAAYLKWLAENEPAQKELAFDQMCRGWAIGSEDFKQEVRRKFEEKLLGEAAEATTRKEARVQFWNKALNLALTRLGKSAKEVTADAKAAPWKVAIAAHLKTTTTSSNPWIAEALQMGAHAAISRYVTEFRSGQRPAATAYFSKDSKG